jgi:hypothetical protein
MLRMVHYPPAFCRAAELQEGLQHDRHTHVKTEAESCWDGSENDEEMRQRYLKRQNTITAATNSAHVESESAEEEEAEDEEDEEEVDEDEDSETADDDDEYEDDEEDEDEEDADADEEEPHAETSSEEPENVAPVKSAAITKGSKVIKHREAGSKTKAESIREVIEAKQKAGAELRPRDIVEALEKRGIAVNASQVSITLRSMGVPPLRKGGGAKKKQPVAAEPEAAVRSRDALKFKQRVAPAVAPKANTNLAETEKLLAAADTFMRTCGGHKQATDMLDMCARLLHRD